MANYEITLADLDYLLELAALDVDVGEKEILRRELNKQLLVIRELEKIDIDGVQVSSHGVMYDAGVQQRLREDVLEYCPLGKEILAQGANTEADYFVVPETLHFDLPSK